MRQHVNGDAAEHIEMLRRNGIEIDPSLELPECPEEFSYLLDWFDELRFWSHQAFAGVHPLVWADVHAWRIEMKPMPRPTPSDYRMLMQLDGRYRMAAKKHEKPPRGPKPGR